MVDNTTIPLWQSPLATPIEEQWYLKTTQFGYDIRLPQNKTYTGAGIRIGVFDNGFDTSHSVFAARFDNRNVFKFTYPTNTLEYDHRQGAYGAHGTAIASIIGARNQRDEFFGVARDSILLGYNVTNGGFGVDNPNGFFVSLKDAYTKGLSDKLDIVNLSLNSSTIKQAYFAHDITQRTLDGLNSAIDNSLSQGRWNGKKHLGTILVKSAGDERATLQSTGLTPLENNSKQIVVAAVQQNGVVTDGSSFGSALLISAFGQKDSNNGIQTADTVGWHGYHHSNYTTKGTPTDIAAAMVSGSIAVILQAAPKLGWRDMQNILAYTARTTQSDPSSKGLLPNERYTWQWNGAETWNGGGLHYSLDYGFGLIDVAAALRLAQSWTISGPGLAISANEQALTLTAPIATGATASGETIDGVHAGGLRRASKGQEHYSISTEAVLSIERVELTVGFDSARISDLTIRLISPSGTDMVMLDRAFLGIADKDGHYAATYTFSAQGFRGETAKGTWQVVFTDHTATHKSVIHKAELTLYGLGGNPSDRYVYTADFAHWAGQTPTRKVIHDTDGGRDTINTVLIASDTIIDTRPGKTSTIDGVQVHSTGQVIENVVTGAGNDTIHGNWAANRIFGMEGNDWIKGWQNNDSLWGGDGNDELHGHAGNDRLFGGRGNDRLFGGQGNDKLDGGGQHDKMHGGAGNDILKGGIGLDKIEGGRGDDILYGQGNKDSFVFRAGDGRDRIVDFQRGIDRLTLSTELAAGRSVAQMFTDYVTTRGRDTLITFADGTEITLQNVILTQRDFMFSVELFL